MSKIFEDSILPSGFRIGTEDDLPLISLTVAQAFADYKYPVPSNEITYSAHMKMNYELGRLMAVNAIEKGAVLTNEDFSAVLIAVDISDMCDIPLGQLCGHIRVYGTEENAVNVEKIFTHIGEMEKALPLGENVIYIEALAVQTAHQGEKRASKLVRFLISEAKKIGKDLFLFTNTERNVSIYKHLGFDVMYDEYCKELNSYTAFMYCKTEDK